MEIAILGVVRRLSAGVKNCLLSLIIWFTFCVYSKQKLEKCLLFHAELLFIWILLLFIQIDYLYFSTHFWSLACCQWLYVITFVNFSWNPPYLSHSSLLGSKVFGVKGQIPITSPIRQPTSRTYFRSLQTCSLNLGSSRMPWVKRFYKDKGCFFCRLYKILFLKNI